MTQSRPFPLGSIVAVRGVSNYQDEVVLMREGHAVRITHEPANEHDSNACVVVNSAGAKLGYVAAALAPRLVARGEGAWRGKVTEVRRGETWGMSISVDEPLDGSAPGPVELVEPEAHDARAVRARSGRVLGILVRTEGHRVIVRNAAGSEVTYPSELVRLN